MNNTDTKNKTGAVKNKTGAVLALMLLGGAFLPHVWAQAGAGTSSGGAGASSTGAGAGAAGTTGAAGTGQTGGAGVNAGQNNGGQNNAGGIGGDNGVSGAGSNANGAAQGTGTGVASGTNGVNSSANGQNGQNTSGSNQNGQGTNGQNSQGTNGQNGQTGNGQAGSNSGTNGGNQSLGANAAGNLLPRRSGAPVVYNLARTVANALSSSSDLQVASRNVQIDRKRADENLAAGRPTLGTSATATRFDQATKVSIGSGPPATVLNSHREELSILLGQRLDLTGQIRASANQFFLQSTADQYTFQSIRNARILRAKSIYFNLLRAQHQVQVAQAALATAQRQLLDAQNLNAGQVGQKIDVYRAATQVAQDQQQLTAAINNEQINEQNFNDLVGQPLATPARVEDVPGVTVGTPIIDTSAVGANTQLSFTPFTVPASALSAIDLDQSLNTAFATRPELFVDQVNIRVAQTGITLARAGLQPTLALNASGNYFPTLSFQDPRKRTAAITATLNIPLYDGGATRDRVDEARLRTSNAQTNLESDKSSVALDVRQSYLNLLTSARQIDAANSALQQAVAARQLAQIRYEGQVGLYLEVTDAQAALVQAETSQVNAVYDYLVARAQFENAIGRPQTR